MVYVVTAIYLIWFVATAATQLSASLHRRWIRLDVLRILPSWSFFAPSPGKYYYQLYYRAAYSLKVSEFRPLPNYQRLPFRFPLNPGGRLEIMYNKLGFSYLKSPEPSFDKEKCSLRYLLLLNAVRKHIGTKGTLVQFAIVRVTTASGALKGDLIMTSDFHAID